MSSPCEGGKAWPICPFSRPTAQLSPQSTPKSNQPRRFCWLPARWSCSARPSEVMSTQLSPIHRQQPTGAAVGAFVFDPKRAETQIERGRTAKVAQLGRSHRTALFKRSLLWGKPTLVGFVCRLPRGYGIESAGGRVHPQLHHPRQSRIILLTLDRFFHLIS